MARPKKVNPEKLAAAKEKATKKEINAYLKTIGSLLVKVQKLMCEEGKPVVKRKKRVKLES